MNIQQTASTYIHSLQSPLTLTLIAGIGILFSLLSSFAVYSLSLEWIPLVLAFSIGGIALIVYKPVYWLYFVAATMRFILYDEEDGFSIFELTLGLSYLLTLLFWLFWYVIVQRKTLVRNKPDMLLIAFLCCIPFNGIIAYTNGVDPVKWFREIHNYIFILYYFPIREYITTKKELITLLTIIALAFMSLSIQNILAYKRATTDAKYAFQLIFARSAARVNSVYFSLCAAFGFVALSYMKKNYLRVLLTIFVLITVVASLTSMARTSWVIVIASALFSMVFAPRNNRVFFTTALITIIVSTIGGVMLFGGKNVGIVKKIIDKRLSSVGKLNDYSYLTRVNENEVALELIQQYPLGGNGIGKDKLHYDLVIKNHEYASYIHNGYISLAYKLGIPMALLFFSFLGGYTILTLQFFFRSYDKISKGLALCCFLAMCVYFVSNIAGCVFDIRQGVFITFIIIGLLNTIPNIENSLHPDGELSWQK